MFFVHDLHNLLCMAVAARDDFDKWGSKYTICMWGYVSLSLKYLTLINVHLHGKSARWGLAPLALNDEPPLLYGKGGLLLFDILISDPISSIIITLTAKGYKVLLKCSEAYF